MDTDVRDLDVAFFKAYANWFNDICSKDLSNRPIYAVLNTQNLDTIPHLKYVPIVIDPARIVLSDLNLRNAMVCETPYLQNKLDDPRFFFTVLI